MQFSLDLETLSTRPDAAIVSIGCVAFNGDGIHATFYEVLELDVGGHVDADTCAWWARQPRGAVLEMLQSLTSLGAKEVLNFSGGFDAGHPLAKLLVKRSLTAVLLSLGEWMKEQANIGGFRVWACSPSFDCVILKSAYERADVAVPWDYWNERDLRTLRVCSPELDIQSFHLEDEVLHHALHDALAQAREIIERAVILNLDLK